MKQEILSVEAQRDIEQAPGLEQLADWALQIEERTQVELELALSIIRGCRLGELPVSAEEQAQAAFARTGDKILRLAITKKNKWHDRHHYDYKRGRRRPPSLCDQIAMGIY